MAFAALSQSTVSHRVFGPDHHEFSESMTSYWSKQEAEVLAAGVFKPLNAHEVASALKILHDVNVRDKYQAPFAIRSGGHQAYPGSANIAGGLSIDIRLMNSITLDDDQGVVTVGAGCTFEHVYNFLEPKGLSIPGARVAQVGVSGFTLGGGISYYSPKAGFVCDNVERFEIVTADGLIFNASVSDHADLWKALKGGGNNFGVVTSITFKTIKKEALWGGALMHSATDFLTVAKTMHENISSPAFDTNAAIMLGICHLKGSGQIAYSSLKYTKPMPNPPVMQGFTNLTSLHNSMRTAELAELTHEEGKYSLPGERRLYMNCSIMSNADMFEAIEDIWKTTLNMVSDIKGIEWAFVLNPIVPAAIRQSHARGGNALGITSENSLVVILILGTWDEASDDTFVETTGLRALEMLKTKAAELGVFHPYIYMNYAWKNQRVIDGYGAEAKAYLQGVSKKYDADGIFQKAVPGGFKLFD